MKAFKSCSITAEVSLLHCPLLVELQSQQHTGNTVTPQTSGHLSVWTRRGIAAVPGPRGPPGPLGRRDEEVALPHPGCPTPPPAPHGGRELAGRPGGPAGARREQRNQERQWRRREEVVRLHGGTA